MLKEMIQEEFDIPPFQQVIEGLLSDPENEDTLLIKCTNTEILNSLTVRIGENRISGSFQTMEEDDGQVVPSGSRASNLESEYEELEMRAISEFLFRIPANYPHNDLSFHIGPLGVAVSERCLSPPAQRKNILLYFHNASDPFAATFWNHLANPEVVEILKRTFVVLCWNTENPEYHSALEAALKQNELHVLVPFINKKVSAAVCLVCIDGILSIHSCTRQLSSSLKDFVQTITAADSFLKTQIANELKLNADSSGDKFLGSRGLQQVFAEGLCDRDYDGFEYDEHDHLKMKIAYALVGQPTKELSVVITEEETTIPKKLEDCYEEKVVKVVNKLFDKILEKNNEFAEYKDKVEIAFIYNCTEPLLDEKLAKVKKANKQKKKYVPDDDIAPVPIFILRKCHNSNEPCRIFIDDSGRVYETWADYLEDNVLPKCKMTLPKNGRYGFDTDGKVLLEEHFSPACGVGKAVLTVLDITGAVGGVAASGVLVAAATIPAVAALPFIVVPALATGIAVGAYSIVRSSMAIYDRTTHEMDMSFLNPESRAAYLNIVAGSLGFVGPLANVAVAQLIARGLDVGKSTGVVVNVINIANLGAGGASLINSAYDVFDQYFNENQTPSMLTIVQLSSSLLFFGHAVYNFKTCSTIIEETQNKVLNEYKDSLRSNRHRKTFTKLMKDTIRRNDGDLAKGQAEVIKTVRYIQNKDDVFAALTRNNKAMNKKGIQFHARDGKIHLNNVPVDMTEFTTMNKKDMGAFLSNLPAKAEVTPAETSYMLNTFSSKDVYFNNLSSDNAQLVITYAVKILHVFSGDVRQNIIDVMFELLAGLTLPVQVELREMFPNGTRYMNLIEVVVGFFHRFSNQLAEQQKLWKNTSNDLYYSIVFDYIDFEKITDNIERIELVVRWFSDLSHCPEITMKELLNYFCGWFAGKVYEFSENRQMGARREAHSASFPKRKVTCSDCKGHFFAK